MDEEIVIYPYKSHKQREKQAPYRDPDARLDPATPGSRPEPKADTQPQSHPGDLP